MRYAPHDYQAYAIDYIEIHPIATVFLDMGLGKTSITLTAISNLLFDSFEVHRVLVIAPLRVARDTWTAEVDKWDHLQNLICSVAIGTEAERKAALMRPADIYIINRENVQWLVEESGIPFTFDMIVIDELSSFKNHNAKRFKSILKVRPSVSRIVGLTGTPASNGLMDLWAEFRILDMGQRLGRFITKYRTDYFMPDKRNGQIIYSYKPLPYAEDAIYRQISDITISMKSTDHLQMPELVNSEYTVQLSDEEREHYDELKRELVLTLGDGEITAANAASLSGKLSQMANGAIYDDNGEVNADADNPAMIRVYIPAEAVRINKLLLNISFEPFRGYTKAVAGGGETSSSTASGGSYSETTDSGGGTTSTSESISLPSSNVSSVDDGGLGNANHNHAIDRGTYLLYADSKGSTTPAGTVTWVPSGAHTHGEHCHDVYIPSHAHSFRIGSHRHTFTVPSHTHEISFGIYTGTTARSAAIKVDGNTIPTVSDYQNIDIAPYLDCDANGKITRNTWHEIAIYPDALTRIAASVFTQLFTNSRGSGDY